MAIRDYDSDVELEIEGETDIANPNSSFLQQLKGHLARQAESDQRMSIEPLATTSTARTIGTNQADIDRQLADWAVQMPYSCKLTLEEVTLSDQAASDIKSLVLQVLKK